MWRAGVRGVVLASFPDFVKEESAGLVGAAVQIVLQAAFFLARGGNERAKLGFEEDVSPFLGAESDDQDDRIFREFRYRGAARTPAGRPLRSFAGFPFGHVGGDCTPNSFNRKEEPGYPACPPEGGRYARMLAKDDGYFWSASFRPAFRLSKFRSVLSTRE